MAHDEYFLTENVMTQSGALFRKGDRVLVYAAIPEGAHADHLVECLRPTPPRGPYWIERAYLRLGRRGGE